MKNKQQALSFLNFIKLSVFLLTQGVSAIVYAEPIQNSDLISISVKESNVSELYEMLSRQNNVNILLGNDIEELVTVNLYGVTVEEAIYDIASAAGLAVERMNSGYLISKPANVGKSIAGGMTDVRTYKIQYSDIKKVSEIIKKHLSQYGKVDILESRNLLVVEDKQDFLNKIGSLVAKLDQAPAQILIEARILLIDLSEELKYGVDWTKTFTAAGGSGNVGVEHLGQQALDLAIGAAAGPPGLIFNYVNKNIEVQLNLLSTRNRIHTLSAPSLLALEYQEAAVIVGGRTGYKVTTTINQVTTESIQFLESGVILKVTPHIDRQGRIMMEIHPEVSSVSINDGIPSLSTTEVNTQLLVEDGQMIFMGGLISNDRINDYAGVPVLEDIPILSYLFSKDDINDHNKETVVLIRPHIIHPGNMELITYANDKVNAFDEQSQNKSEDIDKFFEKRLIHEP